MIPVKIEELIFEGKAEFKTQTFGLGKQFFLDVSPGTFIIVLGFDFSPRAFSLNSGNQSGDAAFLLQQILFTSERKTNSFLYKPRLSNVSKGSDTIWFGDIIQNDDLYLVFDSEVSIYLTINTLENITANSDTLPVNSVLKPIITGGGTAQITSISDVQPGQVYAPLQEYGTELGIVRGDQRDLIPEEGSYTPVTTDPSNYPFLTVKYALMKFPKPDTMQ